ncbi:MAG: hypothetical protein EOM06_04270 [Sphingobacteriia bacterium]|nr:hypothetical protein [Sphingobacteriia bacterium]
MFQFLETIKVECRVIQNPVYHQLRMFRTMKDFFPSSEVPVLNELVVIPDWIEEGTYKCRIVYGPSVEKIEFEKYVPRQLDTLKIVYDDEVNYSFKFANRKNLNQLLSYKGVYDDVLIVKNGFITDTSYCNILFYDGKNWVTPDRPLLTGTCRQRLLDNQIAIAQEIRISDLIRFNKFMLINAMLDFNENRAIDICNIKF